jgi:archaellum component FlaC
MLKVENLPNISESSMKNATHVQFHKNTNELIARFGAEQLGIQKFYTPYYTARCNVREALLFITKSELSGRIADKDNERGEVYRTFSATVKGMRKHFEFEIREMANSVWSLFMHYGDVTRKPLNDESAAIDDMLRQLDKPEMAAKLEALQLTPWRNKLAEVNNEVKRLMMDRLSESANKTVYRMKTARMQTDRYYRAIVAEVNNRILIAETENENFIAFVNEINENIRKFKMILAQDLGRKKKKVSG